MRHQLGTKLNCAQYGGEHTSHSDCKDTVEFVGHRSGHPQLDDMALCPIQDFRRIFYTLGVDEIDAFKVEARLCRYAHRA